MVELSSRIPWEDLVGIFNKRNPSKQTGRPTLNPRVLICAVIIKHVLNLDDRETVAQITENMYPAQRDKLSSIFLATE
ncbi:transposase [Negadavirga shengliensis]|uniref:Transposase n=1 Tax=Negadavirga shengliensis TaxID=1389218 RepID=A0ABV9T7X2_9BACT